ncbi:MAG: class I SAM-dependent methyltransferase [Pseudomonadota bacterium]
MSPDPPWIRLGPMAFWRAAWVEAVDANPRWRNAEADEAFWADFAQSYDARSPLAEFATDLILDLRGLVPAGGTLLEIGSGTGAFTRRLAPGLSAITCVEPSAAMRRAFEAAWEAQIPVDCIASDWLTAPEGLTADVVLCANALYRTAEIAEALQKMTDAARCHVAIVQSVGRPHAGPLHLRENGHAYERERADALSDVLNALEIAHTRKDYKVMRPDGLSRVALLTWPGAGREPRV